MDNVETTALYQNIQNGIIKQLGEGCLTDMVLDVVMPMFEPFIEERLSNFKLYREAIEKDNCPIVTNWKPSEEQMNLLLNIEGILRERFQYVKAIQLAELYEQLKKLM